MFTIAISTDRIMEQVYALAHLHTYLANLDPTHLLTPDNAEALRTVTLDAITMIALDLMPRLAATDIPSDASSDQIATFDIDASKISQASISLIRNGIDTALTHRILATVFDSNTRLSHSYSAKADDSTRAVKHLIDTPPDITNLHIAPW